MKKFEFKLEKLLSYKTQMTDSELLKLAELRKQQEIREEELKDILRKREDCRQEFEGRLTTAVAPSYYRTHLLYMEELEIRIRMKKEQVTQARALVQQQLDVVRAMKLETKSLETIRSSRFEEYKQVNQKKAEEEVEEFVVHAQRTGTDSGGFRD
jgi:flagellar export protein FliJ